MIRITDPILTSADVAAELIAVERGMSYTENGEISDMAARTIASWWQSSGAVGSVLASLASGCAVSRDELIEDIAMTGRTASPMWPRELEMLATWALNHD